MAVVYLPEDKRWSMLGQGFGELIGTMVGQHFKQQDDMRVMQGVDQIYQDQNIPDNEKPIVAAQQFGQKGYLATLARNKMIQQQAATQHTQAETELAKARMPLVQAQTQKAQAESGMIPVKAQQAQATLEHTQAETAKLAREAAQAEYQSKIFQNPDVARQIQGALGLTDQQMAEWQLSTRLSPQAATQMRERTAQTPTAITEKATAQERAKTAAAEGTKAPPTELVQQTGNSLALAQGLSDVADIIQKDPKLTGGVMDQVWAYAQRHGWVGANDWFGRPLENLGQFQTTTQQLVATAAQTGSGFGGEWRVRLAADTLPHVNTGKVRGMLELAAVAQHQKLMLEGQMNALPPSTYKEGIQKSIDSLDKVVRRFDSLWWTKGGQVYWHGKQVDPNTLTPTGASSEIKGDLKVGNQTVSSEHINNAARSFGFTPEAMLEYSRIKLSGGVVPPALKQVEEAVSAGAQ